MVRAALPGYLARVGGGVAERRALCHIAMCRTAALGGHVDTCDACGHVRISYNSCRDRHCPRCQGLAKAEWLAARCARLLPVPYVHVVFTLPAELRGIVYANKRATFDLLFAAASHTLLTIAADARHLGATVGFTAILHTWSQDLSFHPHLHCVVTAGGLSPDQRRWVPSRPRFFLPVRVLASLFRGVFLAGLDLLRERGELVLDREIATVSGWRSFRASLYATDWLVYAKPPFGGPVHVYRYLGRYTHRVAITSHRLLAFDGAKVTFRVRRRSPRDSGRVALDAIEFVRRLARHVLPPRFVRIRHYGLLAGRCVATKLARAAALLDTPASRRRAHAAFGPTSPWWHRVLVLTGFDLLACPACLTGRLRIGPIHTAAALPLAIPAPDTS